MPTYGGPSTRDQELRVSVRNSLTSLAWYGLADIPRGKVHLRYPGRTGSLFVHGRDSFPLDEYQSLGSCNISHLLDEVGPFGPEIYIHALSGCVAHLWEPRDRC